MSAENKSLLPLRAGIGTLLLAAAFAASAQSAGEVEFSRGVGFAQTPGQTPRTLGRGLELKEGDRLTTSDGGTAIIKLQDGTRMTVRPNSELVLTQYQFKENAQDNSMLMQLVRGGFRAVTGLINKTSPTAARIQTATATIGIRGTDFDARLCQADCARESAKISDPARPNTVLASGKIVTMRGQVFSVNTAGERHALTEGGALYPGDTLETMPGAMAVVAFRDESRMTVGSNSKLRIDNFVYDEKNAEEGRFLTSILRGSVRALTGLIAKANNRNVGFTTATATIGIRGTGFDIMCTGVCAGEPPPPGDTSNGLTLFTWLGSIAVTPQGQTALQVLQAGQGLFISPQGIRPVTVQPPVEGDRPDQVNVPPKLFASTGTNADNQDGLFVFVRDGHVEVRTANDVLELGKGEVGVAGTQGDVFRPGFIPKFISNDPTPPPNSKNPLLQSVLADAGIKPANQCK